MLIAHDEKQNRVSIDRVKQGEKYYCPICGLGLIVKSKGKIRKPHFAHKIGSDCDWGDMSEWHISWQEKFPEENREVIIEKNGIKHRADVRKRQTMRQRINERRFSAARFMALGWQFIRPGKQRVQL